MKCREVQSLLVAFLDEEITPSERALIQEHLSACIACQKEMALVSAIQNRIGSALQRRAAQAVPSPEAWNRLEARLARDARLSPQPFVMRLARLAPDARRAFTTIFAGGVEMRKRLAWMALVVALTLLTTAVAMLRGAAPVSAQDILNRSYAAQQAADSGQGILHMRTEGYQSLKVTLGQVPGSSQVGDPSRSGEAVRTIQESYMDPQTGRNRLVVTDEKTGVVIAASAFDGRYLYTSDKLGPTANAGPVQVIYRTTPPSGMPIPAQSPPLLGPVDPKSFFDAARQDPTTKFVGKETWSDGREVYVLRAERLAKFLMAPSQPGSTLPPMTSTLYFDSKTYELVGQQVTIQQDGKETIISSTRQLVRETLPATTAVAWDLGDLKGVKVVDDPSGEHAPKFPAPISEQELVSRTHSAYKLQTTPAGFTMRITAPPAVPPKGQGLPYSVEYRNADGEFFRIDGGLLVTDNLTQSADETYTTHSGLVLYFTRDPLNLGPKPWTHAFVKAPDGTLFDLLSSLPRERVKTLAEELVTVR